jgi:predicted phage replisome organizer
VAESKKYYWLKLKEDFFDEDTIQWIEEQSNGKEYCLFYLKLCLKSLKADGLLIRNVGNILIPYEAKKLAEITNTDIDTVRVAMELFKKIGLVQMLENGEIYLTQLDNMVGSETSWANKKRLQRTQKDNERTMSLNCPTEIEIEIELEIDKELELELEKPKKQIKHKHGEYNHVLLTDKEYQSLITDFNESLIKEYIKKIDEYIEQYGKKGYKNYNLTIRNWINRDSKGGSNGSTGQNTKTSKGKWTGFKPKQSDNELTAEDRKWAEENLI